MMSVHVMHVNMVHVMHVNMVHVNMVSVHVMHMVRLYNFTTTFMTIRSHNARCSKSECYALEARNELIRLTDGKTISLKRDHINEDRDEYGRLLRYVFLSDETLVNDSLIQNGFAEHLSYFPTERNGQFAQSEEEAREANLGLWTVCK